MARSKVITSPPMTRRLLTRAEAAQLLAVSPGTLSRWAAERQGPPWVKLSDADKAAVRYPADGIEEFIARRMKHEKTEGAAVAVAAEDEAVDQLDDRIARRPAVRRRPK